MAMPELAPIEDADLPEFCAFLHRHLDPRTPAGRFQDAFERRWGMDKPNHGFLIRDGGELVGGIGAIYCERSLHGRRERFCNITSWCVLEDYRAQSMRLAMALVSQEGFHFTDLTPTEVVEKSLRFLKFRPLDGSRTLIANLPRPGGGGRVLTGPAEMEAALPEEAACIWRDHRDIPWLRHLALGGPGGYTYVAFKARVFKGLPSAEVLGVTDAEAFLRHLGAFGRHVLWRHGMVTTRIESRFLPRRPALSHHLVGYRPKMYRSETLSDADIDNFYSEIMALDL